MRRIAALTGAALTAVLLAPAAMAGTFCNVTGMCGDVTNSRYSATGILATDGWPADASTSHWQRVAPGAICTYKDCDGFYIPYGYIGFDGSTGYAAGWHKISDTQNLFLNVQRR